MAGDLTTSGINSMVSAFQTNETNKLITPLNTRKAKYQNLSSAWSTLNTKLGALNSLLADLKATGTSSIFSSKGADSTNSNFVTATATGSAANSAYAIRVSQLAKADIAVSKTFGSSQAGDNAVSAGVHTLNIASGDYQSNFDVEFTGSETASEIMQKISDAVNADTTANVNSSKKQSDTGSLTIDASNKQFTINVNGTDTTVTLQEGTNLTYSQVMDNIVSAVNGTVSGVSVKKVTSTSGGNNFDQLVFSASDPTKYITIDNSTQSLLQDLNVSASKERGAATLASASSFSPVSGYSKFSLSAKNTGYSNRLVITSDDAFSAIGLNSSVLTNRYKNSDDGAATNDNKAGFVYGTRYLDASLVEQGTAETITSNSLNSIINFNGLNVQRDSNTISDLVTGVSFTLKSVMQSSDTTVNINVSASSTQMRSKIDDFVSKFNDAYAYIKNKSGTDKNTGSRGLFLGEASASSILSSLSSNAYSSVSGLPSGAVSMLSQIGISFDPAAGLSVSDSTKLNDQLANNTSGVAAIFNSTNGIANNLSATLSNYLGSSGMISKLKSNYDSSASSISDKITSTQTRIDKEAESLRLKYERMQSQLANLISATSWFTATS